MPPTKRGSSSPRGRARKRRDTAAQQDRSAATARAADLAVRATELEDRLGASAQALRVRLIEKDFEAALEAKLLAAAAPGDP